MNLLVQQNEARDQIAAEWLLETDLRRIELQITEEKILECRGSNETGIRGSKPGDETANRGQAMAAPDITRTKKWLAVIDRIEKALPQHLKVLLRLRREYRHRRGPNGWMPIVQHRYAEVMAKLTCQREEETYRSASRMADYWDEIVNFTVREAIEEGNYTRGRIIR